MERARTRIDDDEWYLDVDPEEVKGKGAVVETEHFFVGQAFNAHIQVFDKSTGSMCMHISCTQMLPKERLQAFADRLEKDGGPSIEAVRAL